MNATIGTSGILVILVGMALASFPVIASGPNGFYVGCIEKSLPQSFCQAKYTQILYTAAFPYRPAGETVAVAGIGTLILGILLKKESWRGGSGRSIHWGLVLMGGIAILVNAFVVLQIAGSATSLNAAPGYTITSSDPYYQTILPAFCMAFVGLFLCIGSSIGLIENLFPRE